MNLKQPKIIEAGHFYLAKGPTIWSQIGLEIAEQIKTTNDQVLLFIDDVHPLSDVQEKDYPLITNLPATPDLVVMESAMVDPALAALEKLASLGKKKGARLSGGKWFCADFPLTNSQGFPLCVLLDLALTIHKSSLGYTQAVNILPDFYLQEQQNLQRLIKRLIPDFELSTVFYDLQGKWEFAAA